MSDLIMERSITERPITERTITERADAASGSYGLARQLEQETDVAPRKNKNKKRPRSLPPREPASLTFDDELNREPGGESDEALSASYSSEPAHRLDQLA
jgi:hypothetical protein